MSIPRGVYNRLHPLHGGEPMNILLYVGSSLCKKGVMLCTYSIIRKKMIERNIHLWVGWIGNRGGSWWVIFRDNRKNRKME